jgi:hypothetical protein
MKLAVMLRIVRAVQFVFDKLAALLRGKGSDEMRANEFLGESPCTRSAVDQHSSRPAITRLQQRTTSQTEKS